MGISDEFDRLWQTESDAPNLKRFLSEHGNVSASELCQAILIDQYHRWQRGEAIPPEEYFAAFPEVDSNEDVRLEILLEEYGYVEAHQFGETSPVRFADRFPKDRNRLLAELEAAPLGTTPAGAQPTLNANPSTGEKSEAMPSSVGRYQIDRELGKGTFGTVYLATDSELDREVAIKVPAESYLRRFDDAASFLREAKIVAALNHPNIVPVYDIGQFGTDQVYVVSRFIDGANLGELGDPLEPQLVAELIAKIARALHYAHLQGIVHRDVKPANILLANDGTPFLVDFGLSKQDVDHSVKSQWIGTPAYMSPEQARGESHRVDGRSDIFGLGVIMYELLTGRRPWRGKTTSEILNEIRHDEVRPPRQLVDTIDRELERICLRSLANHSSQRYTTALDFAEDLDSWCSKVRTQNHLVDSTAAVSANYGGNDSGKLTGANNGSAKLTVVPRGLRSYDAEDAEFFLELFPGPRNRLGIPDTIQFWISSLDSQDPEQCFPVGLVYGPSGCGKSSMIRAGVLPRLGPDIKAIYLEAQSSDTERILREKLINRFPALQGDDLTTIFRRLRTEPELRHHGKVLIIVDQFEQWLHHWRHDAPELASALRQCDGWSLQTVLMVRDDFWMATTRFMRELDVPLVERQNSEGVDLFDVRHGRRILTSFGLAYECCEQPPTEEQQAFINKSIDSLAVEGKVSPVRLAVFAEMAKSRSWTEQTFADLGGSEGVGVAFLDDSFGTSAPPQYRFHATNIRRVLQALMPDAGTNIKGAAKSHVELLDACGLESRRNEFEETLRILDNDLRLITPCEFGGDSSVEGATTDRKFALTHDFLVPSVREWLTREERETRAGRATLKLAERSYDWNQKPENRRLPTFWEFLRIRLLCDSSRWTADQRAMMKQATRWYSVRAAIMAATTCAIFSLGYLAWATSRAHSLVKRLVSAHVTEVPSILAEIQPYQKWVSPKLTDFEADELPKLNFAEQQRVASYLNLALRYQAPERNQSLIERILSAPRSEHELIVSQLGMAGVNTEPLWGKLTAGNRTDSEARLRAATALARLEPQSEKWELVADSVAQLVAGLEPQTIGEWIEPLHHVTLHIQDRLAILFREGNRIERLNTARILAPFSIGNAELQYDLATTASHHQLQAVAKSFSLQRNEEVIQRLKSSLEEHNEIDNALEDKELDRLYGLRANAIALLANVDSVETFFASLQASEDETQRSFVIHRFAEVVTNKSALLDRLAEEDDNGVRQGIILTLGEVPLGDYSESDYERAKRLILHIFVHEPDAGVQGAAEWLLRRWNLHSAIKQVADQLPHAASPARDWYYTNLGYRMVIVRPQSYWVGTNPNEAAKFFVKNEFRRADIKFAFAIADRETCGSQFERFLEDHPRETERGENIISRYVRYEDCPVMNVTWYEAAHFCNWLSQREGIPEDQWCYTPNADGKYDAGMKIVAGRIHLTGYQLPIRECWQCAARGGTSTARPFGRGLELMPYYMWTQKSAKALAQPVAVTKPNRFGIFDALGNASEWSGGLTPRKGAIVDGFQITDQTKFAVLGGSLRVNERTIRSDYFNRKFGVARDDLPSTIRPMRIIVDPAKP